MRFTLTIITVVSFLAIGAAAVSTTLNPTKRAEFEGGPGSALEPDLIMVPVCDCPCCHRELQLTLYCKICILTSANSNNSCWGKVVLLLSKHSVRYLFLDEVVCLVKFLR
jgi:hypothetical protein